MNLEKVEEIANAVLYEGYMLYPYRASSVKNRQRFNWGALAPKAYSDAQNGTEAWEMQTECLVTGDAKTELNIKLRFLHLTDREIGRVEAPTAEVPTEFEFVPSLEINGRLLQAWQEAVERDVDLPAILPNESETLNFDFSFPATREVEPLRNAEEKVAGVIVRTQSPIQGEVRVRIVDYYALFSPRIDHPVRETRPPLLKPGGELERSETRPPLLKPGGELGKKRDEERGLFKITVQIRNKTPFENAEEKSREDALLSSIVSTHTILGVAGGEFVSLLEPPDELREAAESCQNIKTYPILVGEEGDRDCMLSSPIILYDYPQIAPESAGDLFDGAEIDEILTLRIMTLTDEEKREMRGIDDRARKILERTEMMPEEQLLKMHGAMRGLNKAKKANYG